MVTTLPRGVRGTWFPYPGNTTPHSPLALVTGPRLPMVVEMARLNMRLELKVHTLSPGSRPLQPARTRDTADSWKLAPP